MNSTLKGLLAILASFVAGFLIVWGLYGGFAFWKSAEPPSIEAREHVRSLIEEVITDWAAEDGVHGPSVAEWDALCEGLAVVDGDMNLLEAHVDGQRLGWLALGVAEIFGDLDAWAEEKGILTYTPAMFCEDMDTGRKA